MVTILLFFIILILYITFLDFQILSQPVDIGINPYVHDKYFFLHIAEFYVNILLRIFAYVFMKDSDL